MKYIVTGAGGFIGSSLCEYLEKINIPFIGIDNFSYGYKEYICDFSNNFVEYDIINPNIINYIDKDDIIIHLAAISSLAENQSNPINSYQNNLMGTLNLLEASRIKGVKHFIFASTSAVYENSNVFPSNECDYFEQPYLLYSLSKKQGEELCKSYSKNYNLNYTIIRFFNVYGPKNDYFRSLPPLIPYIIKELYNNNIPILHSTGEQKRDYVYIDDLIDLILKIINNEKSYCNIYNASSNITYSVNNIYEIICLAMKKNIKPLYNPATKFWDKYPNLNSGEFKFNYDKLVDEVEKFTLGENLKAFNDLGWKPSTNMQNGIENIVKYFIKNFS
jgi:nucleoside-diphosphate-sugar epimerase